MRPPFAWPIRSPGSLPLETPLATLANDLPSAANDLPSAHPNPSGIGPTVPHVPDHFVRARRAVTGIFVLNGFLAANWIARIPAVQDHIGLGEGTLGLALLGMAAGSLVAMPIAGWGIAKVGSKILTLGTLTAMAAALPTLALANTGWELFLVLALFGAAFGSCDVTMNAQAVEVEQGYGRPILVSFHAGFSFGGLGGALAGGLAAGLDIDTLPHFGVISVVGIVAIVLVSRYLLPFQRQQPVEGDAEPERRMPVFGFIRSLPPRLMILGMVAFACLIGEGAMADWTAVYLDDWLHTSGGLAAGGYAAFSLTMAIGRLVGDRMTARWGPVAILRRGGTAVALGLGTALILDTPWAAIIGCAFVGAGLAATFPVVLSAAGKTPGLSVGPALAVASTCGYFGFLVGPPLIGLTAEVVGLPTALGIVAVMGVVIAVFAGAAGDPG